MQSNSASLTPPARLHSCILATAYILASKQELNWTRLRALLRSEVELPLGGCFKMLDAQLPQQSVPHESTLPHERHAPT
eukprot:42695-Pelagomonas_calceolata.AAC.9